MKASDVHNQLLDENKYFMLTAKIKGEPVIMAADTKGCLQQTGQKPTTGKMKKNKPGVQAHHHKTSNILSPPLSER